MSSKKSLTTVYTTFEPTPYFTKPANPDEILTPYVPVNSMRALTAKLVPSQPLRPLQLGPVPYRPMLLPTSAPRPMPLILPRPMATTTSPEQMNLLHTSVQTTVSQINELVAKIESEQGKLFNSYQTLDETAKMLINTGEKLLEMYKLPPKKRYSCEDMDTSPPKQLKLDIKDNDTPILSSILNQDK